MSNEHKCRVPDYLEHILKAVQRIKQYTDDMVEHAFLENELVQDAVIRNIEIIGEACRNIDRHYPEFSEVYHDFPLRIAYEMRNVLAHGYFQIDLEIVWTTIQNDFPKLEKQVQKILKNPKI
ncbi:MAG: hypothetical protein A3F41_02505 [Coxiella sp. RIFCSPHIGHO2_12_FULL_44_14]|nr:MAG: hypothetical protein A3F41_02505 [Coxiella sp. RIFCSPHIGHO2_12_FULL_44_14]